MSEYSPLPWRNVGSAQIASAKGMFVASTIISEHALAGAADANAALIVRAVNAHAELVAALDRISTFSSGDDSTLGALRRLAEIRNEAQTALAKVRP